MGRPLNYSTRFSGGRADHTGAFVALGSRLVRGRTSPAQHAIRREWEQQSAGCFAVGACAAHRDALMALKTHQPQDAER